jgi:tetratricopeptide (TPR) repeat protein
MDDSDEALAAAHRLADRMRWREALAAVEPARASAGTAYDAHCVASMCLINLGELERAHHAAVAGAEVRPDDAEAHYWNAVSLSGLGRRAAAVRAAAEAVRSAPGWASALHLLAICQLEVGQDDAARQTAELALVADPDDPRAHHTAGEVAFSVLPAEAESGDGAPWDEAERALRSALELDPGDVRTALHLASVLRRRGRAVEALHVYLAVARRDPGNHAALNALDMTLYEASRLQVAWNVTGVATLPWVRLDSLGSPAVTDALRAVKVITESAHTRVNDALVGLLKTFADAVESIDGEPRDWAWTYQGAPIPRAVSAIMVETQPWHVLGFADDPIPVLRQVVQELADDSAHLVTGIAEFVETATTLAEVGGGPHLAGVEIEQVFADIGLELRQLRDLHRECADILGAFAQRLWHVERQLRTALDWAGEAVVAMAPGAAPAEVQTDWAAEQQHARQLAEAAVDSYGLAETHCVEALQDTLRANLHQV